MPTILVLRGLPGAGKTTWAREYLAAHRGRVGRVSRDDARRDVFGLTLAPWDAVLDRAGEDVVTAVVESTARALLAAGLDVIADACHLTEQHVDRWRAIAAECEATVDVVDLAVPVEECIARDLARASAGGRSVGALIIRTMSETGQIVHPQEMS
jgi:predicted kinase